MPSALVVDDDPDLRRLLFTLLDRAGYEVWTEPDGEAGLTAAVRLRPDVALLDWLLPGRSGVEVCRAMRDAPELAHTAIILITARGGDADMELGYACGVDDYVVKPFRREDLLARMGRAIRARTCHTG